MMTSQNNQFKQHKGQQGFTLVELLLAFALFSVVLVMLTVGILRVGQVYQSGTSSRRTQQSSRVVSDELTRYIRNAYFAQFEDGELCLDSDASYIFRHEESSLVQYQLTGTCQFGANNSVEVGRLLDGDGNTGNSVQLRAFEGTIITGLDNRPVSVEYRLIFTTGNEDLVNDENRCSAGSGLEFCSSTVLSNTVTLRGG